MRRHERRHHPVHLTPMTKPIVEQLDDLIGEIRAEPRHDRDSILHRLEDVRDAEMERLEGIAQQQFKIRELSAQKRGRVSA